jgi:hypothetical protein
VTPTTADYILIGLGWFGFPWRHALVTIEHDMEEA